MDYCCNWLFRLPKFRDSANGRCGTRGVLEHISSERCSQEQYDPFVPWFC
jgi:hypothetical protein